MVFVYEGRQGVAMLLQKKLFQVKLGDNFLAVHIVVIKYAITGVVELVWVLTEGNALRSVPVGGKWKLNHWNTYYWVLLSEPV